MERCCFAQFPAVRVRPQVALLRHRQKTNNSLQAEAKQVTPRTLMTTCFWCIYIVCFEDLLQ
jgi:hypothetical protein